MTPEYRKAIEALRACSLAELRKLELVDLRRIKQQKAKQTPRSTK